MFEQALADKFRKIFSIDKISYDAPAPDDKEQDTIFIEVTVSKNQIRDGLQHAHVEGKAFMFCENEKLPYGFFSKAIRQNAAEALDIYFYQIEENTKLHNNLSQRGFSFVYFFSGQFDPALGTLTSIELEVSET